MLKSCQNTSNFVMLKSCRNTSNFRKWRQRTRPRPRPRTTTTTTTTRKKSFLRPLHYVTRGQKSSRSKLKAYLLQTSAISPEANRIGMLETPRRWQPIDNKNYRLGYQIAFVWHIGLESLLVYWKYCTSNSTIWELFHLRLHRAEKRKRKRMLWGYTFLQL